MALGDGYRAFHESAAWLDLSGRGPIRMTGEDRVRLLHALAANHIQQLKPGEGCYTFFLDAQGHILGDANVLCLADALLLDTEPETRRSLYAHLDRYLIADDVTLEDESDETAALGVEGPQADGILRTLGAPVPTAAYSHERWGESIVARLSATGAPGFRIFAPLQERTGIVRQLKAAGAVAAGSNEMRTVRLEHGRPRFGEDIDSKYLPQETRQLHAVHFNKGCYLGQEIVERVRSRGAVHRQLVHLEIDATEPPEAGARIFAGEKDIGELTSAAYSPALGKVIAMGYVRVNEVPAEAQITTEGAALCRLTP
ncbi:MAG: glycine cleavage T C-terminal barrel domain-containing protein [Bryobacteraceae bacterium]